MTLVSNEERLPPRIAPKVFSDVPTQAELESAKKRSAWLLILCVFFAGCFAAAALGLAHTLQENDELHDAAQSYHESIAHLEAERDEAVGANYEYRGLHRDHQRIQELRQSIAAMLAGEQHGAAQDDDLKDDLAIYNKPETWPHVEQTARQSLQEEIRGLEQGQSAVQTWHPGPPNVSPFPPR